jgi:quinol monooxygenase YgiN
MATAFAPIAAAVQAEEGCEQYEIFQSCQDPDTLVLLERWTTPEDLDVHMDAMQARGPSPTAQFRDESVPTAVERYEV